MPWIIYERLIKGTDNPLQVPEITFSVSELCVPQNF
jgi:hypothetical protein